MSLVHSNKPVIPSLLLHVLLKDTFCFRGVWVRPLACQTMEVVLDSFEDGVVKGRKRLDNLIIS